MCFLKKSKEDTETSYEILSKTTVGLKKSLIAVLCPKKPCFNKSIVITKKKFLQKSDQLYSLLLQLKHAQLPCNLLFTSHSTYFHFQSPDHWPLYRNSFIFLFFFIPDTSSTSSSIPSLYWKIYPYMNRCKFSSTF